MLERIMEGKNLSFEEAYSLYNTLLKESDVRIAGYLVAMQMKGYTAEELAGMAKAMRDNALRLDLGDVCATCGTGGDGASTINVSTASAIVLSMFRRVAKHGNVSVTSKSGSANVLDALGIKIDAGPDEVRRVIERTGFAFIFAPLYHPTLKRVMPVRKELGVRTVFNILGPLANPANPKYQIVGVNSPDLVEKVAEALLMLGVKKALVVHGSGLDEVSPKNETIVAEVSGDVDVYRVRPEDFGIKPVRIIPCKSPEESARRIVEVFRGRGLEEDRTFITLNAGFALYSADVADLYECMEIAKSVLNGEAASKLEEIRNACPKD